MRIERVEHWFLARPTGGPELERPPDDQDWERRWLPWEAAIDALTYDVERRWLRRARDAARSPA